MKDFSKKGGNNNRNRVSKFFNAFLIIVALEFSGLFICFCIELFTSYPLMSKINSLGIALLLYYPAVFFFGLSVISLFILMLLAMNKSVIKPIEESFREDKIKSDNKTIFDDM